MSLPLINDANRRWWTLGAMCFALFMLMLDNTVVNVALPSIQRDLDVSLGSLEWTINAYALTLAILLVTGGRLGDMFGRRRVFLIGVAIFGGSSLFIAFSQTDTWLIFGRAVQGAGAALMMPATLSIITNTFPPEERGKAIGTWAGASAVALAIGPVVGGFLVENVSWQSIFLINVPIAAGAVVVTLWATRESRDEESSLTVDYPGIATLTLGLGALVLGLVETNSWGWGSNRVIGLFALAIVGLLAFAAVERRSPAPMVDFTTFRSRAFLGASVVGFIVTFTMLAMYFFIALYMQNVRGYGPLETGLRFLPSTLVIIVMGPIAGRLADRVGSRPLMTFGMALCAGALFWQGHLAADTAYVQLAGAFTVMGAGLGLTISPMSTAGMNAVEDSKAGVASGILSMSRMVGGSFGVAVMGAMIGTLGKSRLADDLPGSSQAIRDRLGEALGSGGAGVPAQFRIPVQDAFLHAVNTSMLFAAGISLVGAAVAWLTIGPRRATDPAHETLAETAAEFEPAAEAAERRMIEA